jgi:hypothetical protein
MGIEEQDAKNGWSEYGRLVLKELERLNDGQEALRKDFDEKFKEINTTLQNVQNVEKNVTDLKTWHEKVTDVWSPTQMKEAKDELYKQKNQWTWVVAIVTFVQIVITIAVMTKGKLW